MDENLKTRPSLAAPPRGVKKRGAYTVPTRFSGAFPDDPGERTRLFNLLRAAR